MDSTLMFIAAGCTLLFTLGVFLGGFWATRKPKEARELYDRLPNLVDAMQFAHVVVDAVEQISTREQLDNKSKLELAVELLRDLLPELGELGSIAVIEAAIGEKKDDAVGFPEEPLKDEAGLLDFKDGRKAFDKLRHGTTGSD